MEAEYVVKPLGLVAEIEDIFTIEPRRQKARVSRNPKTNEKVNTPEKKAILFKMSKEWAKKVNEKE